MVKGPSILGLKPGIEVELRRQAPDWSPLVRLLEEQSGVALPSMHALLLQWMAWFSVKPAGA